MNGEAGRDDQRARRLEDVAPEQTLPPIASRDRDLDPVGKRFVRTLIDQGTPFEGPPLLHLDRRSPLSSWTRLHGFRRGHLVVEEVSLARRVEHLAVEDRLDTAIAAERGDLIEQVSRVACAQRTTRRQVVPSLQVCRHHRMEPQIPPPTVHLEDASEILDLGS